MDERPRCSEDKPEQCLSKFEEPFEATSDSRQGVFLKSARASAGVYTNRRSDRRLRVLRRWAMAFVCLVAGCLRASGTESLLTDFRPSTIQSEHGAVSEVDFSTGLVVLESGVLAHHLMQAMKDFRFAEPVWVIGYQTEIVDAAGQSPQENFLCHTFFGDERVTQHQDWEMRGIYSDAFTPAVQVPDGFGIPLGPDDRLHWMPMFNNRTDHPARVEMRVRVTLIREKDLRTPLKPLYATLQSIQVPHLYFVPPGHDEKEVTFEAPFDGEIHFLGTHVHPYGVSIELFNVTRGERVWKGTRKTDSSGKMQSMEVFSSLEGYPVHAGEQYRVTAVYENPTSDPIDAMAGLFMLYSRR
jgi:hypothetical protein